MYNWYLLKLILLLIGCVNFLQVVRLDLQSLYNVRFEVAEDSHLGCYIES